ncbi:MAG: cob(I)yrinic acid a,c-diamide adenosyltransferase [Veillonella sp.]|nr:cob(I)yrinic acid a,c-diamide adenosyltransferase [Veillonella sp.]
MSERGLILVNTGNGKGKTTAALGVVLRAVGQGLWKTLVEEVNSDKWDLIVMDEINNAINYELIDVNSVVDMLKQKPERLHVILTGRYAKPEIIDIADTVTEMNVVKHAYEKGIKAAKGIEF